MAATMTEQLATAVRDAVNAAGHRWDISTSRAGPRELRRPLVMIRQQSVSKPAGTPRALWTLVYDCLLLVPNKDPDKADAQLEPRLDYLLELLDGLKEPWRSALIWTEAERVVFNVADGIDFHGYRIPLSVGTGRI